MNGVRPAQHLHACAALVVFLALGYRAYVLAGLVAAAGIVYAAISWRHLHD